MTPASRDLEVRIPVDQDVGPPLREVALQRARERDRAVPRFIERELRGNLECGLLCHGFIRVRCAGCVLEIR